jgi:nucleotide-binding universal stress UspA family protein
MFKRILVPIDGSKVAALGLDMAIKLARDQEAKLYILHVTDIRAVTQNVAMGGVGMEQLLESMRADGRKILALAEAQAKKRKVTPKVIYADTTVRDVADVIVSQAKKIRADLVVLGTHGRRGFSRLVMGSDAEGVVRNAPAPIMLVRPRGRGKQF